MTAQHSSSRLARVAKAHAALAILTLTCVGCGRRDGGEGAGAARRPAAAAPSATPGDSPELRVIRAAEAARAAEAIPIAAASSRDVLVRRGAARALARIADARAMERLERSLADEDPEVVAWAAHGLGATCSGQEPAVVRLLVARAASLSLDTQPATALAVTAGGAIADALARCGTGPAEQTLRAWLEGSGPRAEAAAYALGRLAGRRHRLDDATLVALLDAAARTPALGAALYPFGRLDSISGPVAERLEQVARAALGGAHGPDARLFAIRALALAGPRAAQALGAVFSDEHAEGATRAAAATALGRVGADGEAALLHGITAIAAPDRAPDAAWLRTHFSPLLAALRALPPRASRAPDEAALVRLAESSLPAEPDSPAFRRLVELRCAAAVVLANTASLSLRLVQCAPKGFERVGALATLRVLDRGGLTGARFEAWKRLATGADPAVRRAALAVAPAHPELPPITTLLAGALQAREPGVVAQAARVLAALAAPVAVTAPPAALGSGPAPETPAPEPRPAPAEEVVAALARALDAERPPDDVETRAALASAAGVLGALRLKPRVEKLCASENVTVRRAAEAALRAFGNAGARCEQPTRSTSAPVDDAGASGGLRRTRLTFVLDSGRFGMTLDPALAPLAVGRVVALAQSGFYDHLPVHKVLPGAVVQLGDRVGDGYGGAGRPPLPSETSPVEFPPFAVGMALAGRDTGSSQIFVALSREPNLSGDYPILGVADADWVDVAQGDVVDHVEARVEP